MGHGLCGISYCRAAGAALILYTVCIVGTEVAVAAGHGFLFGAYRPVVTQVAEVGDVERCHGDISAGELQVSDAA